MTQFSQWQISEVKSWPFATENRDMLLMCWLKAHNISGKWGMKHIVRYVETVTSSELHYWYAKIASKHSEVKNCWG